MIPLPELTATEMVAMAQDMRLGPYLMRPTVQMLDRDHHVLSDLSERVTDGQVDTKLTGLVASRSASITLVDPTRQIAIDGNDTSDGGLFYDKMIAAGILFKGPRLGRWVEIPVFCGPLTNASRNGYTTEIVAQDKARLATGMVWTSKTYPAGADKITTMRSLLQLSGEAASRIQLPGVAARLPKDIALTRESRVWNDVTAIAQSLNRQGMYDGRGDYRLRSWPEDPSWVITDGDGGTILTHPQVTYDPWTSFNGVLVQGPPKKSGKRIESVVWLPRNHPLSPWSLARGGVPFRVAYPLTNGKIRTQAEADVLAARWLRRLHQQTVQITVDVMPNWLLEPGDVIAIRTAALGYLEQKLTEFSLPLLPGASMSLGATRKLARPKATAKRAMGHRSRATATHTRREARPQ